MKKNAMAKSIVGVELGSSFLKLVEYLPVENQVAVVAIKPLDQARRKDDDYLGEQIRHCLRQYVTGKSVEINAAVGAEHAVIREVEVPLAVDNVQDHLEWEMEQVLNRPLTEYLLDYQDLGPNAQETSKVYLVAAFHRAEVERLKGLLESSGHAMGVMDIDIFAALNAFEANYPEKQLEKTLLLKADLGSVKGIKVRNAHFLGFESVPLPEAWDPTDAETRDRTVAALVGAIRDYVQRVHGEWGGIESIFLCGDLAQEGRFSELLESNVPVPLERLNAFKQVRFTLKPEKSAAFMPSAPQCAAAVGLALRRRGDC